MANFPSALGYPVPREHSILRYVAMSLMLLGMLVWMGGIILEREPIPMVEVELGIGAVENEPPPLGTPDAGAGEMETPGTPSVEPEPKVDPEPEPERQLQPEPQPGPLPQPPEPQPEPEPQKLPPEPKPEPQDTAAVIHETPTKRPRERPKPAITPGSGLSNRPRGTYGTPFGVAGGRGGSTGDFIRMPAPQYDKTARDRNYQGSGRFLITYENGRIIEVSVQRSTGADYLDSRTMAWIRSTWRVKPGVSGQATVPIVFRLKP